jgi:hypothetical protein
MTNIGKVPAAPVLHNLSTDGASDWSHRTFSVNLGTVAGPDRATESS